MTCRRSFETSPSCSISEEGCPRQLLCSAAQHKQSDIMTLSPTGFIVSADLWCSSKKLFFNCWQTSCCLIHCFKTKLSQKGVNTFKRHRVLPLWSSKTPLRCQTCTEWSVSFAGVIEVGVFLIKHYLHTSICPTLMEKASALSYIHYGYVLAVVK